MMRSLDPAMPSITLTASPDVSDIGNGETKSILSSQRCMGKPWYFSKQAIPIIRSMATPGVLEAYFQADLTAKGNRQSPATIY